ncbi:MAG TPA: universal stress protein [Dehalococcoidia bacterium]|nr:universal stress protein [Dehalococcoidia bacterium]
MPDLKVIAALDGSALSEASLRYIPLLRALGNLDVMLVGIVETYRESEGLRGAEAHIQRELNLLEAYLDKTVADLGAKLGATVRKKIRTGVPADEIVEIAREEEADLLVLTTHGRSGIGRWAIGSVADKVLHTSDRNILVIGPQAAGRDTVPPFRQIMVPLDGSGLAEGALPVALTWAAAFAARLHLVRVVPLPIVSGETIALGPDLFDAMREAAEGYLSELKERIGVPDAVTAVPVGPIAEQLGVYEQENAIDLAIMTSHGRGGLLRSVLGSVTDRMLHGPAPVLVVRARA